MPFLYITDSKRTASHAADQPRTHFFQTEETLEMFLESPTSPFNTT